MSAGKQARALVVAVVAWVGFAYTTSVLAHPANMVEYRLEDWKTTQFQDATKAKGHHDTLKWLGCEVFQEVQGSQIVVRYRCVKWKQLALANHAEVHQWEKWLRAYGFQVKHGH